MNFYPQVHDLINVLIVALICFGSNDQTVQICLSKSKSAD